MRLVLIFILLAGPVYADPPGPPGTWQGTVNSEWIKRQKNIIGGSCCSNADGHVLDDSDWRSVGDAYEVRVGDAWYKMPSFIMRDATTGGPNPTGHAIVWYTFDSTKPGGLRFWCFAPGTQF